MTDHDFDIDLRLERTVCDLDEELSPPGRGRGRRAAAERRRAPARAPRGQAGGAEQPPAVDTMDQYIRSLGSPPVLSKEQTFELARSMEAARDAFLEEMYAIPGTAVKLVERWIARRDRGHVTAVLSARYRDQSGKDRGPEIDRALGRLARLLERRERLAGSASPSAAGDRTALDGQIARATKAAGIVFEVVEEVYRELSALRGAPRTRATRDARRRFGLDDPAHRARLNAARRAMERMDRDKQTFVVHNLRLVMKQAKRFRNMGVPYTDLIQEGNLGLIRAVEKFDYRLGYKFSTYAVWWIDQALVRAVQNTSRTVRVPSHVYDLQVRLRRVREQLRTKLARAPTPQELAEAVDVTVEDVEWATTAMQPISSTQDTLPGTEEFTLEDALADEAVADPAEAIDRTELGMSLGRKVAGLDPRERQIIDARFGLSGAAPRTLQQIGDRMGISRERVRQIESRALAQLREGAEADGLWASLDLSFEPREPVPEGEERALEEA
jgi:RNA polymerase primary sigma factor